MFKKDMKLPETKFLFEVDKDLQQIINFLKGGQYEGNLINIILYTEEIIGKYSGRALFNNSDFFALLGKFMTEISLRAQNEYVKLSREESKKFADDANSILLEYNELISRYKEEY